MHIPTCHTSVASPQIVFATFCAFMVGATRTAAASSAPRIGPSTTCHHDCGHAKEAAHVWWSLNEDFGRRNRHLKVSFRSTFQWIVAQILYSHP